MINLLPSGEKQKLVSEKKKRLATVLGFVLFVSLICLALIFLAMKYYILAETDSQRIVLEQVKKEQQTPSYLNFSAIIKDYNEKLRKLDAFNKKEIYLNHALKIITDVSSPNDLHLTNFSITRDEKNGIVKVGLSGISDIRDSVVAYKRSIESTKDIKKSYFFPQSWINPINANFSLTLEIGPNK